LDPITLSVLSGVLFYVVDKRRKRAEAGKAQSLDSFTLPTIGAAEVESFTSVVGPEKTRQFDRVVSDGLPALLGARSLVAISQGPVGRIAPSARVYRVVPLAQALGSASETIAAARAQGQIVLGSLSLIGLSWGSDDPMLVIMGGPELKTLVSSPPGVRGDFALLPPRIERVVVEAPKAETAPASVAEEVAAPSAPAPARVVESVVVEVVEAKPKAKANGIPREPAAAVVTTTAEVVKE
jgi:hypothetical protein